MKNILSFCEGVQLQLKMMEDLNKQNREKPRKQKEQKRKTDD